MPEKLISFLLLLQTKMVEKVIGKSNELELIFEKCEDGSWKIAVPRNVFGQYYLDIYAIDQAGNQTFVAKALFEVDPFSLCYKFELLENDMIFNADFESDYEIICKEVRCLC